MGTAKVEAIQRIPSPTTVQELQRFLGTLNYYRRFIHRYAQRSFHMRQLLRKDGWAKMNGWDSKCEAEFLGLKKALMTNGVMVYPDPT
ncbi:MAG: hypothetical protein ACK53Y_08400, partial [bacterium]